MNLRDLDYILAVSELRHFGLAAERCNISQPTLSNQIRKLEEFLGITLFERTNRSVAVTEIGQKIIDQARLARDAARAMQSIALAHRDPFASPVRLGAIPTLSPYLAPSVLPGLAGDSRKMTLIWSEEVTDTLLDRLDRHELDAALIATPLRDDALEERLLFDEPFWLAFQRGHRFGEIPDIDTGTLISENLLLLSEGHCLRDQVSLYCRARPPGESRAGDFRAASLETLLSLVGAGYGCTLIPALAVRPGTAAMSNVDVRQLAVPEAKRTVRLVFRRSTTRREALTWLADLIQAQLPETVIPR